MYNENCSVIIQYENNLKQPIGTSWAPNEVFVIGPTHRVRISSLGDDLLDFVRIDTVLRDMLDVPIVPTKLQKDSSSPGPRCLV
jgi:hypothetical protein